MDNEENEELTPEMGDSNLGDKAKEKGKEALDKGVDKAKDKLTDMAKQGLKKGAEKGAQTAAQGAATSGAAGAGAAGAGAAGAGAAGAAGAGAGAAAGGAAAGAGLAAAAYPILIATAVIICIITIIGILMFFITMPGMVIEKIKQLAKAIAKGLASWFGKSTTEQVEDETIYLTLDYLKEMGYDLKGYGFITKSLTSSSQLRDNEKEYIKKMADGEVDYDKAVEFKEGVGLYNNHVVAARSEFIYTYLVSDNYVYTLANHNLVTEAKDQKWYEYLWSGFLAITQHGKDFLFGSYSEKYTEGMIHIYNEGSSVGTIGSFFSDTGLFNFNDMDIDPEKKTFEIKKGIGNAYMTYNLDGWTGRYGMPVDFLLSVHVATMMPDLAMDMAGAFKTQIAMVLHPINGAKVDTSYKDDDGNYLTYEQFEAKATSTFFDTWRFSREEAAKVFKDKKMVITSKSTGTYSCVGNDDATYVVLPNKDGIKTKSISSVVNTTLFKNNFKKKFINGAKKFSESTKSYKTWTELYNKIYADSEKDSDGKIKKYKAKDVKGLEIDELKTFAKDLETSWDDAVSYSNDQQTNPFTQAKQHDDPLSMICALDKMDGLSLKRIKDYDGDSKKDAFDVDIGYFLKVEDVDSDNVEDLVEYTLTVYLRREGGTDGKRDLRHLVLMSRDLSAKEIQDKGYNVDKTALCSSKQPDKVCKNCRRYIQYIYNLLKKPHDNKFDYFVPYIAKVTDHWYRDVYFVLDKDTISFVQSDFEYEALTKERWTEYETDKTTGEYIYYLIDDDGKYGDKYEPTKYDFIKLNYTKQQLLDMDEDELKELGITEDEIDDIDFDNRIAFAKKAKSYSNSGSDADKKEFQEAVEDLGWVKNGSVWSAYKEGTSADLSTDWEQLYPDGGNDEIKRIYTRMQNANPIVQVGEGLRTETNPTIKKFFLTRKYFRYDGSQETADAIEAFRNKYFKTKNRKDEDVIVYGNINDATTQKEEDASKRKKLIDMDKLDTYKIKKADVNPKLYKYANLKGDDEYFFLKDFVGNVSLNSQSLSAFSMLENENTLDAEYVYRDFKELIVELGYFTKQELTNETPELLGWVIPEVGSAGWPDRTIDKSQYVKGTMIHSRDDLNAMAKMTMAAAMGLVQEVTEISGESEANPGNTTKGIEFDQKMEALGITEGSFKSVGAIKGSTAKILTLSTWWEECQKIFDIYKEDEWVYDDHDIEYPTVDEAGNQLYDESGNPLTHKKSHGCNGGKTFEQTRARADKHWTTDCSLGTSWLLHKLGVVQEPHTFASGIASNTGLSESNAAAQDMIEAGCEIIPVASENITFKEAVDRGTLKPGDVLFYPGHVSLYCGDSYKDCGKYACWDTGSTNGIQYGGPRDMSAYKEKIKVIVRPPFNKNEGETYYGYDGNEEVVSPVTGVLLDYGTYDPNGKDPIHHEGGDKNYAARTNTDIRYPNINSAAAQGAETPEPTPTEGEENQEPDIGAGGAIVSDKVGYAVIMILTPEQYQDLEKDLIGQTVFKGKNFVNSNGVFSEYGDSLDKDTIKKWNDADKLLYGYKEFAENYSATGLAGNIVVIDGFVCEDTDIAMEAHEDGIPKGEKIEKKDFDAITKNSFDSTTHKLNSSVTDYMPNYYLMPDEYKLASKKATEKLNAEEAVKGDALGTYKTSKYTFIKEGTLLGRTMTDKELNYSIRGWDDAKYKEYRPDTMSMTNAGNIMGNYLRMTMTVPGDNETVVENIEDYMRINREDGKNSGIYGDLESIDKNSTDQEKVRAAMSYFISQGFTVEAAAGILGNLIQESALSTTLKYGQYTGLAQWNTSWYADVTKWIASQGLNEDSFAGQVRAICEAPNQGCMGPHWAEMKTLTNIDQATECFCVYYEGCIGGEDPTKYYSIGTNYQDLNNRKKFAQNAYDIFKGDDNRKIKAK